MWRVMPWDLSAFVGRASEASALARALGEDGGAPQLHSLYGVAGVGKTRLARVVAHEVEGGFPGGIAFAEGGVDALAAALGAPPGSDAVERVVHELSHRERTLCVVDQAGAMDPDLPAALGAWLSTGAHAFVVTSRAPLEMRGARRLEVGPLAPADGVELLLRRVDELGAAGPSAGAAARLVDEVGGLPLGIELCAGALVSRSADSLLAGLHTGALTSSDADVPARHRSLERAAEDTWRTLDPADREALVVASVFAGAFSRDDFEALAGGRSLDRLIAHGLVARSGDEHRVSRWLADFAGARAERAALFVAHAGRLLAVPEPRPDELLRAGEALVASHPEVAARALFAGAEAMARTGSLQQRRRALDFAIDLGEPDVVAASLLARAELARRDGRPGDARDDLARLGEPPAELSSRAARSAALLALDAGDTARAERLLDDAVRTAGSDRERARSLAMRFAHRLVLAAPADESDGIEAYDLHRACGDRQEAAAVLDNLGLAALHRGEDTRGRERLARADEEARASGDRAALAGARLFVGLAELAGGSLEAAIAALAEAERMALDLARWSLWSDAVGYGAVARLIAGRPAARAELASHVDELARRGPPHAHAFFAAVLHLVDDARPATDPDLARGRPLLVLAIEALAAPSETAYGLPVRIAVRARRALVGSGPRLAGQRPALEVSRDRRRFRIAGAQVDLTRRGPLGRVFAELVARGGGASPEELIEAGWPGEAILPEAARLRLYNAIASLRSMGLRGALVTTGAGYRLEADIRDLA